MPLPCPACSTANPDEARFCLNCGTRLDVSAGVDEEAHLEPYLPKAMRSKLEAARVGRAMEGERRVVTMLFCDVKGSTAMAERLDPEEWAEIMNGAFEHLIAPIYRYEGTLARLMGDAIFAFFGAPIAHEDDPQRAVSAGLDIVDAIRVYRGRVEADRGLDLNVRVGINTGPVVVGQVGSDLRLEYTAMGDAVNVAARMEQTAEPGTVQITADTYRQVASFFEAESRGGVDVKGKAEPVPAYRVLGRKPQPSSVRGTLATPLVGREREMAILERAIEQAQEGQGRVVSLIAEAGLGKSRLIEETRNVWTERRPEDARLFGGTIHRIWESWQCVSYDTTRPYAQYRRMLARIAGIGDTDPPAVVRDKLAATIEPDAPEWLDRHMRVWRSLFGVQEADEEPLEGEAFKDAIMELVPGSTRFFGSVDPRLLVFEDLHWCDGASMDLLIETVKTVDELPCLFLFAYRPDRQAPSSRLRRWLAAELPDRSIEIELSPLSERDSGALIEALLPDADRDGDVRAQILERAEGNPLFVEEVVASVLQLGSEPGGAVAIPATLQALITARLDSLDEGSRWTLQLASVIGRTFLEPVLRAVSDDDDDLAARLQTLQRAGLISRTADSPEPEYSFHHSLTQEATYSTILLRARRDLHRRVGEVFEELYANRIEEFAPLLVRHFQEAGDDERTLRYATVAGDNAARLHANAEAVTHYTTAIEAAVRLGQTEVSLRHLYLTRGRALELSGRFDEAVANYEGMELLADGAGDRSAVLAAGMALTTLYATPTPKFDAERGRALSERTLALARELGDRGAESKALWNLMILNVFGGGDLHEALDAGERSLAIARELNAREQMAFTLNDLWRPYAAVGDLASSLASLQEATPIWRELGNRPMLSENLASIASLRRLEGDDADALALAMEGYRISEEIGNPWGQAYGLMNAYAIYWDRGEVGKAISAMQDCVALAERSGFVPPQATTRADLASVYANLGDLERAFELIDVALQVATERQAISLPRVMGAKAELYLLAGDLEQAEATAAATEVNLLPEPLRYAASVHIALVRGDLAEAEGDHARAIQIAEAIVERLRGIGIRSFVPEALLLAGRSLAQEGRSEEAERVLREARSEAERLGHRRILREILQQLGAIRAARGDADEAGRLQGDAASIVSDIAASIEDEPLRSAFLALPDVRAVLPAP
ncbi:MAG: adenylate/guanylate cyclase domain-containing protein [Actinomycetota bacterium]